MVKRILGLSERGATIKDGRKNFKPAGLPGRVGLAKRIGYDSPLQFRR